MNYYIQKNRRGFTLIELLLYMSIALVMVIVVSSVSIDMLRASKKTLLLNDVQYTSSFILTTLERIASGASAVTSPSGTATSSNITFQMYDGALNPTVVSLSSGVLYLTEGSGNPIPLHTERAESFISFTNKTPVGGFDSVKVQLGISSTFESLLALFQVSEELGTTLTLHYTP